MNKTPKKTRKANYSNKRSAIDRLWKAYQASHKAHRPQLTCLLASNNRIEEFDIIHGHNLTKADLENQAFNTFRSNIT